MENERKFRKLLLEGIRAIQRAESKHKKKLIKEIEEELGKAIGRQASTIQHFRRGNIPNTLFQIEQLAREILRRSNLGREWLGQFLESAGYPKTTALLDDMLISRTDSPEPIEDTLYRRPKVFLQKQITLDGFVQTTRHIEVEVTSDTPLDAIRHKAMTMVESMAQPTLVFSEGHREDAPGTISIRVMARHEHLLVWVVEFDPPLLRGQKATYTYKTSGRYYTSSAEDIFHQFRSGLRARNSENWNITITAPTDNLEMELLFPPNYGLTPPPDTGGFGVYNNLTENRKEKDRIVSSHGFKVTYDPVGGWVFRLQASHVLMGHTYEFQWIPPYATPPGAATP